MTFDKSKLPIRIDVLDKGFVELQDFMGDDLAIVNAARTSFLGESKGEESDHKLLNYLWYNKHHGPFEQVVFRFRMKLPNMCMAQIVRHRTARLNVQSYRYMQADEEDFYIPNEWRIQSPINKQGSRNDIVLNDYGSAFTSAALEEYYDIGYELYRAALEAGIAREQARLFLPGFAVYYTMVWQIDLRNLLHFLTLRMDEHAQWETRQYANAIFELIKPVVPWSIEAWENEK